MRYLSITSVKPASTGLAVPWFDIFWTDNRVEKLAQHGITPEDFEHVVTESDDRALSRHWADRQVAFGYTDDGRYIICIYELLADGVTLIPVTAYEVPEPLSQNR